MDLSQGEVDEFMTAQKIVPSTSQMKWESPSKSATLWRAPVETGAVQRGMITLYVNPLFERRWTFKLSLNRFEIYRLDVKPMVRHSNPSGRPSDCPGKVTCSEHEHRWTEGLGLDCAYPLAHLSGENHQRILREFCERARIDFRPDYVDPAKGIQLEI